MKKSLLFLLFFCFMIKGYSEDTFETYQIISLENLYKSENLQGLADLSFEEQMDWIAQNWQENWVIEITKGLEMPLNINIKGDFLHLEPKDNYVSIFVDKTFYMRFDEEDDFLFSTDLITWADAEEFFTGNADVRFSNDKDKSLVNFLLELNQR